MKKNLVLAAIFSLCVLALSASAQKAPNFSGTWNLDVSKSKLGDRNNIESQTWTVTQTDTAITVTPATKRKAPPADAPAGGGGGRMGGGGADTPMTYTLDGKEVKTEMQGQQGSMQVLTKAKIDGGKLGITRTMTTPMGDRTSSEKWWLNTDGTLTVESQRPNRDGGTDTTTKVFTKKQ